MTSVLAPKRASGDKRWNLRTHERLVRHRGLEVILSDHCFDQVAERVFDGRINDAVVDQAKSYVQMAKIVAWPQTQDQRPADLPDWVNGTRRTMYLVAAGGRIVFPLKELDDHGRRLLALTCLHKDACEPDLITRRLQEAGLR